MSNDVVFPAPDEVTQSQIDEFALIATQRLASHAAQVDHPSPPVLPDLMLSLQDGARQKIVPRPRVDSAEKLQQELGRLREHYAPFQMNFAPPLSCPRVVQSLKEFQWRQLPVGKGSSPASAIPWSSVTIPHYGGPYGRAASQYTTFFTVTEAMRAMGSLWVCFRGVDYRATVWVNDQFVGQHEGFFGAFEFEITEAAKEGDNTLLVRVENDSPNKGLPGLKVPDGEKIYGATGPGWDEPGVGWHHCPPGMGIYQPVSIESRARLFVSDLHVRAEPSRREVDVWVETFSCDLETQPLRLAIDIQGRNFRDRLCVSWESPEKLPPAGADRSYYKLTVPLPELRAWDLNTPWLYQLQVRLLGPDGELLDARERQFGTRTFTQDETSVPKGKFFLNGREIRLRGANTMGFEQQAVMRGDRERLVDDLLLAKATHLNFLRFTQRPVQEEVYEACDQLGLLAQTDLPHFGWVRRTQVAETIRQVGEMARLVRSHPCRITYSFINEPYGTEVPHRFLTRPELERMLRACREMLLIEDPDAVVKACDGDYNPPAPFGLPDEHIYTLWYNGHAIPFGKLHRGHFPPVTKDWCYGCGEFGAEGLDPAGLMRRRYPAAWLPTSESDEKQWTPDRIPFAQTAKAHTVFFETPEGMENWVAASQAHQAFATRFMTEAFRRDRRLVSCAIHLFIDAWPGGWMKAIMDCERHPKPAYFAYREALTPLLVNLRSDRFSCWGGEALRTEAWICNDTLGTMPGGTLIYTVEAHGRVVDAGTAGASVPSCESRFQGYLAWTAPRASERMTVTLRLALIDAEGLARHDTSLDFEVFPRNDAVLTAHCWGEGAGLASTIASALNVLEDPNANVILVDTWPTNADAAGRLLQRVRAGATLLFFPPKPCRHEIAGTDVEIFDIGSGSRLILEQGAQGSFVASRQPGHPFLAGFKEGDFTYWTDESDGIIAAVYHRAFRAPGWTPILVWGNAANGMVVGERAFGSGRVIVCTLELQHQMRQNPIASLFLRRLLTAERG